MLDNLFDALNKLLNTQVATLPYPEEAPDYSRTISGEELLQQFFDTYFIPEAYWDFWKTATIVVDRTLPYPAGMVSETKTLLLKPEYANPGILAHEFSHLSYAQLGENQKASFPAEYNTALQTDGLLKLLYSQKSYMNASLIEAHAEIFRYLGNRMPEALKKYYPFLTG
jgi:hypothetical protein